jgi:hypothetical protein
MGKEEWSRRNDITDHQSKKLILCASTMLPNPHPFWATAQAQAATLCGLSPRAGSWLTSDAVVHHVCVCVRAHARLFNQNSCDKQSNVRLRAVRCVNAVELAVEATEDQLPIKARSRRVQRAEEFIRLFQYKWCQHIL